MQNRVSQYVFVPTKEDTCILLDQHADTLEGDVKLPLVIVGNEGSGKSALLANWVANRRKHKHRDEFLFQHFAGCSSQSLQVIIYFDYILKITLHNESIFLLVDAHIISIGNSIERIFSIT